MEAQINESTLERLDFGMESTYCGVPGRRLVKRVIEAGCRDEGPYLGTNDPSNNIEERVLPNTGYRIDPRRTPRPLELLPLEPVAHGGSVRLVAAV